METIIIDAEWEEITDKVKVETLNPKRDLIDTLIAIEYSYLGVALSAKLFPILFISECL